MASVYCLLHTQNKIKVKLIASVWAAECGWRAGRGGWVERCDGEAVGIGQSVSLQE